MALFNHCPYWSTDNRITGFSSPMLFLSIQAPRQTPTRLLRPLAFGLSFTALNRDQGCVSASTPTPVFIYLTDNFSVHLSAAPGTVALPDPPQAEHAVLIRSASE